MGRYCGLANIAMSHKVGLLMLFCDKCGASREQIIKDNLERFNGDNVVAISNVVRERRLEKLIKEIVNAEVQAPGAGPLSR